MTAPAASARLACRTLPTDRRSGNASGQLEPARLDDGPPDARRIWHCAVALAAHAGRRERRATAIDVLRAARHDPPNLRHAFDIGRRHERAQPEDPGVRAGLTVLEAALVFLGIAPLQRGLGPRR